MAPAARSRSTLALGIRRSRVRISSVCWPRSGGGAEAAPGVSQSRIGTPITVMGPALGWLRVTVIPRAFRCGLSQTSPTLLILPAGTPVQVTE